jgi:tetrahydromethanopterin S-methyltransferase subunit B
MKTMLAEIKAREIAKIEESIAEFEREVDYLMDSVDPEKARDRDIRAIENAREQLEAYETIKAALVGIKE